MFSYGQNARFTYRPVKGWLSFNLEDGWDIWAGWSPSRKQEAGWFVSTFQWWTSPSIIWGGLLFIAQTAPPPHTNKQTCYQHMWDLSNDLLVCSIHARMDKNPSHAKKLLLLQRGKVVCIPCLHNNHTKQNQIPCQQSEIRPIMMLFGIMSIVITFVTYITYW